VLPFELRLVIAYVNNRIFWNNNGNSFVLRLHFSITSLHLMSKMVSPALQREIITIIKFISDLENSSLTLLSFDGKQTE